MKLKTKQISKILLVAVVILLPALSNAQIRAGAGFLKYSPGARQVGVAGTLTGALDYTYSFYNNPGATGFMREWQWSATYTKWISDIYNASFLYGGKMRTPWSSRTRFVLGINHLGIPEFDSSNDLTAAVSGNNVLLTTSIGQPVSFLTENLSIGANFKYFNSQLAEFRADAFIFDVGLLYRTARLNFIKPGNGFLDYAICSIGASITNMGTPIKYIAEETPLPRALRTGVALNLGAHHGFQLNMAADYRQVRDEDGFITFGAEVSWSRLFSIRMGYSLEDNLLGNFAFGGSMRLDDNLIKSLIPGRNNAVQVDIATSQNNTFVSSPYHGSITHYPIRPENFRLCGPAFNAVINADTVNLTWEKTTDPDLFDETMQWLLVDQDSLKLARALKIAKEDKDLFFKYLYDETFLINQQLNQSNFVIDNLNEENYFWTVLAYDKDQHFCFAEIDNFHISKFRTTMPKPVIAAIDFEYYPWITDDDYQGKLKVKIVNIGDRAAKNFKLRIYDSSAVQFVSTLDNSIPDILDNVKLIPEIEAGEFAIIDLEWRTGSQGLHRIVAEVVKTGTRLKEDKIVNKNSATFYTIPKGTFAAKDTSLVQKLTRTIYELPYVGKVYFDINSSKLDKMYVEKWVMTPPLETFAERLKKQPNLQVTLQGTADLNSKEHGDELANRRTNAVCDTLLSLGVKRSQINILPGLSLPARRLPKNKEDAQWLLQERRRVDLTIGNSAEEELFGPLQTFYNERLELAINFNSNIAGAVPLDKGTIFLKTASVSDSLNMKNFLNGPNLARNIDWKLDQDVKFSDIDTTGKNGVYSVLLTDSLNRSFKIKPRDVHLNTEMSKPRRMYFVLAEFGLARPFYNFYWSNLLDRIPFLLEGENKRIRFIGHGCSIGPDYINERLSEKRAHVFNNKFLKDVNKKYPHLYDTIKQKMDAPEGLGETEPLLFRSFDGRTILLGDNNTPMGRQLNRRVMVLFYTKE